MKCRSKGFTVLEKMKFTAVLFLSCCVQLLQDTLGSTLNLASGSMDIAGSGFRPTRQDVFEFIKQCGNITSTDPDEVSQKQMLISTKTKPFFSQCKDSLSLSLSYKCWRG